MMGLVQRAEGRRQSVRQLLRPTIRRSLPILIILVSFLSACGASRSVRQSGTDSPRPYKQPGKALLATAVGQTGVKYRFGGDSPKGFDCSGLQWWVHQQHGIKIPRTSFKQFNDGEKVRKDALKAGDLVFFTTYRKGASHVGMYDGKGSFVHAPSSGKTVQSTEMSNPWWKLGYVGARRYW